MWPRGGVVTQRAANPCTAGSSPARGLQQTGRHISGILLAALSRTAKVKVVK